MDLRAVAYDFDLSAQKAERAGRPDWLCLVVHVSRLRAAFIGNLAAAPLLYGEKLDVAGAMQLPIKGSGELAQCEPEISMRQKQFVGRIQEKMRL